MIKWHIYLSYISIHEVIYFVPHMMAQKWIHLIWFIIIECACQIKFKSIITSYQLLTLLKYFQIILCTGWSYDFCILLAMNFTMIWQIFYNVLVSAHKSNFEHQTTFYWNKLNNSHISKMCFHFVEIVKAKFDPGRLNRLYIINASYARMICSMNIVLIITMHLEFLITVSTI